MREIGDVLKAPWDHLAHQATGSSDVRQTEIERVEDLGSAEERVRTDYVGRYAIELLQNAHDACADAGISGQVWFQVTDEALLVANEGAVFDADRIASLIRLGASTKELGDQERHTIGYKGIGFTSVFEISDRPQIITKDGVRFGFDRERAVQKVEEVLRREPNRVPARAFPFVLEMGELGSAEDAVKKLLDSGAVTVIRLPLREGIDPGAVLENLQENLVPEVLLFAPSIKTLSIESKDGKATWRHKKLKRVGAGQVHQLAPDHGESQRWLVATEQIEFPRELADDLKEEIWKSVRNVQVAVAIPWARNRPDPGRGPQPLHVYFPTEDRLDKAILIHGDFYVDSSRRHIQSKGAGGKVSELVGKSASSLLARLASSIGDHGNPLLRCLAGSGESSGYGYKLRKWIEKALENARIARPSDGSAPMRASDLKMLGTGLGSQCEKQFIEILDERSSILMPGDEEGAVRLLTALGSKACTPKWIASHLSPAGISFSYDRYAAMLGEWVGTKRRNQQVMSLLKQRQILQDESGEWAEPEVLFIKRGAPIKLPSSAGLRAARVPHREEDRKLLELLGVTELDARRALEMVLNLTAATDAERAEFLEFYKALWLSAPGAFDGDLGLGSILVPVRSASGEASGESWSEAWLVYEPQAWSESDLLEVLYGWKGEPEFLADPPPASSDARRKLNDFYSKIGVVGFPRVWPRVYEGGGRLFELDDGYRWDVFYPNNPCPRTHRNSDRTLEVKLLDRLEAILEKEDASISVRLAEYLASQDRPFGEKSLARCGHSSHKSGGGRKLIPGYQRWLLETKNWIPISGSADETAFAPPSGAWFGVSSSEQGLRLPIAQLPESVAKKLGLVPATSPPVGAIERLLAQFRDEEPDFSSASEATVATCDFLLSCLPGAAKRVSAGDDEPEDVQLPSLSGGERVWSSSPLVPDLPGLDRLPGVEYLPEGDWAAVQERYGLEPASVVVDVRPVPQREQPRWLLTNEKRQALVALAAQQGTDLKRAAARVGRLVERASESLQLHLRHGGGETTVDQDHFLETKQSSTGQQIGGVLYLAAIQGKKAELFRVARSIATYVGDGDLTSAFANFLLAGPDLLPDHGVGEQELARAEAALEKWTQEDEEPELWPEPVPGTGQLGQAEATERTEESGDEETPMREREALDRLSREAISLESNVAGTEKRLENFVANPGSEPLIGTLTTREQLILRLRYGLGGEEEHTLEQIGQILGLSRERVRQLEARALKKVRETQPARLSGPPTEVRGRAPGGKGGAATTGASATGDGRGAQPASQVGTGGAGLRARGATSQAAHREAAARSPSRQRQGSYVTYVVPGPREASPSADSGAKTQTDRAGMELVLEFEKKSNRVPEAMPPNNPGYDIESKDESGNVARFIEVKSSSGLWGDRGVALSKTQYGFSQRKDIHGKFWLYVVEGAGSPDARLYRIRDPGTLIDKYVFDYGWCGVSERGPEELESQPLEEELKLAALAIHSLVHSAVEAGASCPVIGYELSAPGGWQVEAAWPAEKVAILVDHDQARDEWLQRDGWDAKNVSDWTEGALLDAIRRKQ